MVSWLEVVLLWHVMALFLEHRRTFLENSEPTSRFRLQIEQSKLPAHLSVETGMDMELCDRIKVSNQILVMDVYVTATIVSNLQQKKGGHNSARDRDRTNYPRL